MAPRAPTRSRTTRMPRPPPPAAALTRPASGGRRYASGAASTIGVVGTPAAIAAAWRRPCRRAVRSVRCRTDPHQPGVDDGLGEVGVLGEEAVTGVDRVAPGVERGRDDGVAAEVRLGGRDPPSATAMSTESTCSALRSGSEYTPTVSMPITCAVRAMRTAISPRFAIEQRERTISAARSRTRGCPRRRCCAPPTAPRRAPSACRADG